MKEIINIQGFEIHCSKTGMNIINSYKVKTLKQMKNILIEALNTTTLYKTKRSMTSLIDEWIAHNLLFKLNLFRKHTKDCNFESNQKIHIKFSYFILGKIIKIKWYITGEAYGGRKK